MHYKCRVTKTMSAVSMDGRQPAVAPDKISTLQRWMHVNMTSLQMWHFLNVKGTGWQRLVAVRLLQLSCREELL